MKKRIMTVFLSIVLAAGMTVSFAEKIYASEESPMLTVSMMNQESSLETRKKLAVYSPSELEQMELTEQAFTLLDQEEGAVAAYGIGVPLELLLAASGIQEGLLSIRFFSGSGILMEIPAGELLATDRYCYYDLPALFDRETGSVKKADFYMRQEAAPLIVWRDQWLTTSEYTAEEIYDRWEDPDGMTGGHAYRLLFGQHDISERQANRAMAGIREIVAVTEGDSSPVDPVKPSSAAGSTVPVSASSATGRQTAAGSAGSVQANITGSAGTGSTGSAKKGTAGSTSTDTAGSSAGKTQAGQAGLREVNTVDESSGEAGFMDNGTEQEMYPMQDMASPDAEESQEKESAIEFAGISRRTWIAVLLTAGIAAAGCLLPLLKKSLLTKRSSRR